jgi:hypothetical protein
VIPGSIRSSLAAILLAAAIAAACMSGGGGPTASPSPTGLAPGTYTTAAFKPAVTFSLPSGWELLGDSLSAAGAVPVYVELRPAGSEVVGIHFFRDPVAASQDPTCPETAEPSVGGTSSELATWIRGRPGLLVSEPKLAAVGGLRGVELDLGIVTGWTASCPFANGIPTAALFVGAGGQYRWVVAGSERLRLYLLDLAGGGTLVVDIDAFDGSLIDDLIGAAVPIVQSLAFAGD